MDLNASDPIVIASQCNSSDILELCRLFIMDVYIKHIGHNKAFALMRRDYEAKFLDWYDSIRLLIFLFALTWVLKSRVYTIVARLAIVVFDRSRRYLTTSNVNSRPQQHQRVEMRDD